MYLYVPFVTDKGSFIFLESETRFLLAPATLYVCLIRVFYVI